ncbi:hypothetical protein Q6332_28730, partial [Klebsiella pneumoniae]|nr:hypothetical protein [Klebsiella pneumoniae]
GLSNQKAKHEQPNAPQKPWKSLTGTGIPPVLAGLFAWYWLDDKPASAKWLSADEKAAIERALAHERQQRKPGGHTRFVEALKDRKVWFITL